MPLFPYRCENGHEWDERRDRDDPDLDMSNDPCGTCSTDEGWWSQTYMGARVRFQSAPPVYFHGRGWSRVDKNYKDGQ